MRVFSLLQRVANVRAMNNLGRVAPPLFSLQHIEDFGRVKFFVHTF
jgi:hypothetical protein